MKVKVEQVNSYNITIEGIVHKNFTKGSEWNGMIEFKNTDGIIIVAKEGDEGFGDIFTQMFGGGVANIQSDFDIMKVSNTFIPKKVKPPGDE